MKGSDFIFDCVNLLHYKCHKINLNHGKSYIDSPDWTKNKKAVISSINDDDKCTATVPLDHKEIGKNLERISNIKSFRNKYNWKGIISYLR